MSTGSMHQRKKLPGWLSPCTSASQEQLSSHCCSQPSCQLRTKQQALNTEVFIPRVDKGIKFMSLLTQLHLALHVPYTRHHSRLLHTPLYQKGQSLQGNLCNSLRNPEVPAILGLFSNLTKGTRDLTLTAPPASTQSSKLSK